jgi:electron transport complex protein RnfC
MLLYTLLGRRMNPAQLPPQRRVLLLDAAAALAIGRLILHSQPMLDVPIVMRNGFTSQWHVVQVPVGTRVRDVCEQLSIPSDNVTIRAGDVLRDVQISPDAIIASAEISLDISAVTQAVNPSPCIRCGWCVQACPARIHPAGLLEAAQLHDSQLAHRYGVDSCIECGICSYVCPSHLPLLPSIRQLRATISTSS